MPQRSLPHIRLTNEPLQSEAYRASLPKGAVTNPAKAGALVGLASRDRLQTVTRALEANGLLVAGCLTAEELRFYLRTALDREEISIPEAVVVDVGMLSADVVQLLRDAGSLDDMLVILPESWPRGEVPNGLESAQVLQEPFPLAVLVEEVAQRMTPFSIRLS
jgi:hypothetical protein